MDKNEARGNPVTTMKMRLLATATMVHRLCHRGSGPGRRHDQDGRSRDPRRRLHGAGPGRLAGHAARLEGGRLHGRGQEDRCRAGLVGCLAGKRRKGGPQARRAGRRASPDRAAVRLRRHRGQGLRQDAAQGDVPQRILGRPGNHPVRSGTELLPLQHRRGAVDGRARRLYLSRRRATRKSLSWRKTIPFPTARSRAS